MAPVAPIPGHITVLYIFAVFNLILLCHMTFVDADVYVLNQRNYTVWDAQDKEARFGDRVPDVGFRGFLQRTKPRNACSEVVPPPWNDTYPWVALVERYGCDFSEKVYHVQQAGYKAAIVYNYQSSELVDMGGGKKGQLVTIPSVFVGYEDGVEIGKLCESHQKSYTVLIYPQVHPLPIKEMLIPFIICVGICCLIMIGVLVGKWFRDWRKRRKARLSKQHLKKLPTKKFKKGDEYHDCCAICLDDYEEGDKLRILPCQHAYHMKCVDPWLLNNKRVCPVCKRIVIRGDDTDSESDSDDDEGATERTPLLSSQADGHSVVPPRSTFDNSGLPENARREAYVPIDESDEEHQPSPASRSMQSYVEVHGGPNQSQAPSAAQPERQSRFPTLASLVRSTRRNRQDRRAPAEGTPTLGEVVNEQPSRRKKKSKKSREAGGVGPQGSINEGDEGRLYVEQEEEQQGAVGGGPLSSYQGVAHPLMDLVEDHFARDNKAEASNPGNGDSNGLQDETRPSQSRPPTTQQFPQDSDGLPEVAVASGSRGKKKRKRKRRDDNDQA